jgi:hypothetical protein
MTWHRPLLTSIALTAALGCTSPAVHYDYDASTAFSQYRTYAWQIAPPGDVRGRTAAFDNAIEIGRVKRAVEAEMRVKGFRLQADSAEPDFLVSYYPRGEASRSRQVHLGLGFGMGPLGVGFGAPVGSPSRAAVAAIVLEIEDFHTRTVVWKATADDALQGGDDPAEADSEVKDAVHAMLKSFPPK